jgi:hypothetical protein
VILYKIVFHLEKAEREQGEAYIHINTRENGEDAHFEDEPVPLSDRAIELVDRSTRKHSQSSITMV